MAQPTLPSVIAAQSFWRGEKGALGRIGLSLLERSAIVLPALWLAGEKKHLVRYTLATVVAIEAVVLWQVKRQMENKQS